MRAVRFLTLALLMAVGVAGTAKAQAYNNTPGTYDVKVGVVPACRSIVQSSARPSDRPRAVDPSARDHCAVTRP